MLALMLVTLSQSPLSGLDYRVEALEKRMASVESKLGILPASATAGTLPKIVSGTVKFTGPFDTVWGGKWAFVELDDGSRHVVPPDAEITYRGRVFEWPLFQGGRNYLGGTAVRLTFEVKSGFVKKVEMAEDSAKAAPAAAALPQPSPVGYETTTPVVQPQPVFYSAPPVQFYQPPMQFRGGPMRGFGRGIFRGGGSCSGGS